MNKINSILFASLLIASSLPGFAMQPEKEPGRTNGSWQIVAVFGGILSGANHLLPQLISRFWGPNPYAPIPIHEECNDTQYEDAEDQPDRLIPDVDSSTATAVMECALRTTTDETDEDFHNAAESLDETLESPDRSYIDADGILNLNLTPQQVKSYTNSVSVGELSPNELDLLLGQSGNFKLFGQCLTRYSDLKGKIARKEIRILVLRNGASIFGFGLLKSEGEGYYLSYLEVSPTFAGRGFGKQLLQYCVDFVVKMERTWFYLLNVVQPHENGIGFYSSILNNGNSNVSVFSHDYFNTFLYTPKYPKFTEAYVNTILLPGVNLDGLILVELEKILPRRIANRRFWRPMYGYVQNWISYFGQLSNGNLAQYQTN